METYSKSRFVEKYGISCYIPREQAGLAERRLFRTLFYKYPDLKPQSEITIISKSTFIDNPPDYSSARRSRIGDKIVLLDSPELAENLRKYPEDKKFYLTKSFSLTLRGGSREEADKDGTFSHSVTSSVINSAAGEAMTQAKAR